MCKEDSVVPWRHNYIAHNMSTMTNDTASRDEAQRTLERKALRNVRNLVDKLEDEQQAAARTNWRFIAGSIVVALVAAIALFYVMAGAKHQAAPVVTPVKSSTANAPAR